MNVYAPIILCFVPFITAFALFAILVPKISVAKEFAASLAGLLAVIPITLVQFLIPGMRLFGQSKAISILLYSIVFLGLVEELFKALALFFVGAEGENPGHWLCFAFLAGLVFGCFESVIYFLQAVQSIGHGVTLNIIYYRMFTALLLHTLCSGIGSLAVFYAKNIRKNIWPLVSAILIHGLYDYFASFNSPIGYFSIVVILFAAMKCRVYYMRVLEELSERKSPAKKISDPDKTIAIPKNPAIIIPVNKTPRAKDEAPEIEDDAVLEEDAVDFDQIEREAKSELKAERSSAKKKSAAKKGTPADSAKKSAAEKTVAGKANSGAKNSAKPAVKATTKSKTKDAGKTRAAKSAESKAAANAKTSAGKKTASALKSAASKRSAPAKKASARASAPSSTKGKK